MIARTSTITEVASATLEERHAMLAISLGPAGLAWSCRRPAAVTFQGVTTPIRDVALTVRVVAIVSFLLAAVIRRARS